MSFGFSVGDFVTLAELAFRVYNACNDSSRKFNDIAFQVRALHDLLTSAAEQLYEQPPEPNLAALATQCREVLESIHDLLRKYSSLGTKKPRRWDIVRFAARDSQDIREKLLFQAAVLGALNANLTRFSQRRVEKSVAMLVKRIDGGSSQFGSDCAASSCADGTTGPEFQQYGTASGQFSDDDASSVTLTDNSRTTTGLSPPHTPQSPGPSASLVEALDGGHVYRNVNSSGKSIQINGNLGDISAPVVRTPHHYYADIVASGDSLQVNGNLSSEVFQKLFMAR